MKTKSVRSTRILSILCGLSFPILSHSADFPKIIYSVDETDALTYATKAQLHVQQSGHALEDQFLAYHLVQIVRDSAANGNSIDFGELMREANEFKDESSKAIRTATGELKVNDMVDAANRFYAIFDHLPLIGDYISSLHAANNLLSDLFGKSYISDKQLNSQFQSVQKLQSANEIPDDIYRDLHVLARGIPSMDVVVDGVFFHDFGDTSVHDSAKKMRDEDPSLNADLILRENLGADGRLSVDLNKVTQAFKDLSQNLSLEFNQMNGEIQKLKEESSVRALSENETKKLQAEAQAKREKEAAQLDILRTGMSLYCGLLSKFDPQNGPGLAASVRAGFDIADSLSRYKQSLATSRFSTSSADAISVSSSLKLTTDLVQIGFSLANALFSSGPSPDQLILEQLNVVKNMIRELAEAMQAGFDQIDGKLNLVIGTLNDQMEALNRIEFGTKVANKEIGEIQRALLSQQAQLGILEADIMGTLEQSFFGEMDRQNQKSCLQSDAYTSASFMPYSDYRKCVEIFVTYASRPARESTSSETLNSGPIGKNIGALSKIAADRGNFAMIPARAEKLVDPVAWSIGSTAYLKLLESHPEFSRMTRTRATQEMLTAGNELLQAIQGITIYPDGNGSTINNAPFLLGLVDSYLAKTTELISNLHAFEQQYDENPSEGTHSYPLWPEKNQTVSLGTFKTLPFCGSQSSKAPIFAPPGLDEAIPADVKALWQITGSGLELCYDLQFVHTWNGKTPITCFALDCRDAAFGKLIITLNASYKGMKVFSRRVESMEFAAGDVGEPDDKLINNLALGLRDTRGLELFVGASCHMGFGEFVRMATQHATLSPDCLYGKALQDKILKSVLESGTELVSDVERKATLQSVQAQLDQELKKHRAKFRIALIDKMKRSDDIQQALKNIGQSVDLVSAYIKLGLPTSLASNDPLRSSIFGKNKLMSSADIIRLIEGDTSGEEIGHLAETLSSRAVLLRNELAEILKTPVIEPQPLIVETMNQLKGALDVQNKAIPKVGLDEAWSDLRSAASSLR